MTLHDTRALHERIRSLETRQRHLECLLDSARDAVLEMNTDGIITSWNHSAEQMLGWRADEALGQRMCELIVPHQHRAAHLAGFQHYLETGKAATINRLIEIQALHRSGVLVAIELSIFTVSVDGAVSFGAFIRDISGRHQAEQALRLSQERYRAVIEHVDEGMLVIQHEKIAFANVRAAQIVGIPLAELEQIGFLHHIHPDDQQMVLQRQRSRLAGDPAPSRYELRLLLPDGAVRWIGVSVTVVPWDGSKAILTFFSDTTERRKLEEKLRDTLDERETILENSLAGIAFLTEEGAFKWSNHAMARMFGATASRPLPSDWSVFFASPEEYQSVSSAITQRLVHGQAYEGDLQLRRLDGSLIWVTASGKAVNVLDKSQGSVWALMDITPRKELESALARASSEREAIFNSALVGISYNVDRRIQWVNDKYEEISGYQRSQLVGQSTRMLYPDDESFAADGLKTKEALLLDSFYIDERQFRQRNGDLIWVQLAGRCVTDRKPDAGVIWTLLDITGRRSAEDNIRVALKRERELNDLRSRFVSMTSHEFRTPLAAILSAAELVRDYGHRMPDSEKLELLESIGTSVQRMARMLDRVLLIGQVDAHMLQFRPEPTDLLALCHNLVEEARALISSPACLVQTDFADTAETAGATWDPKLIRHILGNLLSNAIKYSPRGGNVFFRVRSLAGKTVFEVEDQGIGIPTPELPHLFESFHRASNVGDIPGTGLGLAIVRNSVELHGGRIEVRSEIGQGSCFTVTI